MERRRSIFTEVGLLDESLVQEQRSPTPYAKCFEGFRSPRCMGFRGGNEVLWEGQEEAEERETASEEEEYQVDDEIESARRQCTVPPRVYRLCLFTLLLVFMFPILSCNPVRILGVRGGFIPTRSIEAQPNRGLELRQSTSVDVCKRFSGQTAVVNGTLYMYGFRTTTDAKQTSNTWTNDFLTLDLTKSWQISSPSLTALPKPSGPPAVSLGYLWASTSSLWLYGGEFSDNPKTAPSANSIWEYAIAAKQWIEHKDPKTSGGQNAEGDGQSVQRAAEGAGLSVSALGRGWYFGGHLDDFTTQGWSNQIARVYLKSLLEFTFPGYTNKAVEGLKDGKTTAGKEGVYRNITQGGLQDTGSFPERADGALVYVPGFGDEGILLGLSGGDNDTFTQMNVIDVYDIAQSTWYKQSTSGSIPPYRVSPCTVVGAAADGSSYNVYMFGGQNLQPAGAQTQKDDMWILSVPSFTWIEVDPSKQSIPYARAGHSCHVWDGQMIVIGGYVSQEISCDSPGIYVFNMSSLTWSDQFTALTGDKARQTYSGQGSTGNPLAQQANQRGYGAQAGLEGSYGYTVPKPVQQAIGGGATGGATLTAPIRTPSAGPLASGKPRTYTVTGPNGSIITSTTTPDGTNANSSGTSGPNIGAIIAGVIAALFFLIAVYFAFCAWVYRKQMHIWRAHAAAAHARNEREREKSGTYTSSSNGERAGVFAGARGSSHGAVPVAGSFEGPRGSGENSISAYTGAAGGWERRSSEGSVTEDLLVGQEPSFWGTRGVLLNPRRSLRVINRD